MWDQRYAGQDYFFGTDPAAFLLRAAQLLPATSRVLCLADGEGRNSVHLAGQGHRVTAKDASPVAMAKARVLAAARGVDVDCRQADIGDWDWGGGGWDAIFGIFIQFAGPDLRARIHAGIRQAVTPGGLVFLHGYAPRQIKYGTGGPPMVENLYTLEALHDDFPDWQVLEAVDYDADIREGEGHSGKSALIDFILRRPSPA